MQKQLTDEGKQLVIGLLQPAFDANPTVAAIEWKQYTPVFCDGDPCYFTTTHDDPTIAEFEDEDGDGSSAPGAFADALAHINEDDYEIIFGNDVRVRVSRAGEITTDYYDAGY